jgi:tetratricopeptide (TPR) repeat protein
VLAIRKKILPSEHPVIAGTLGSLGGFLSSQAKLAEAETNLLGALAIQKKVYADHRDTANTLSRLGDVYNQRGRFLEAERVFREQFAMQGKVRNPADLVNSLNKLSDLLLRQGRHIEAQALFHDSIESRTNSRHRRSDSLPLLGMRPGLAIPRNQAAAKWPKVRYRLGWTIRKLK